MMNIRADLIEFNLEQESYYLENFKRSLPFGEYINDRWERAERLGFGQGTSIYDSSYVIGDVQVGTNCWIGMFTILDGSGGLTIGDGCTISSAVHIYSHDNVHATLSEKRMPISRESVTIGDHCYIGPHAIVTKGVSLGNHGKSVV